MAQNNNRTSKNDTYLEFDEEADRKRLSTLLMISRAEGGLSQEKIALELGVAKKTVQNWEKGTSSPSMSQTVQWFRVLGVAALPYLFQFIFPEMVGIKASDKDEKIRENLIKLIETLPPEGIRQLMFLFYGNHGSSPQGIMNLITAHLQSPMRDRYSHANTILNDYKIAKEKKQLTKPRNVQPNIEFLEKAIEHGRNAVLNDSDKYSMLN